MLLNIAILSVCLCQLACAFCPPGCECRDEQLSAACNFAGLTSIPILLNPMLRSLSIANSNGLKLDAFSIALYQELTTLELSNSHISLVPKGFFRRLPKLQTLSLRGNRLRAVDEGTFQGMGALQSLDLSANQIERLHPDALLGLTNLRSLNLSSNQLHLLPENAFAGLANLTHLHLQRNKIAKLARDDSLFGAVPQLTELDLSANIVSELMGSPFRALSGLQKLDLASNLVTCLERNALAGLGQLRELNLARNLLPTPVIDTAIGRGEADDVGQQCGGHLPANWAHLHQLERLDLSGNAWKEVPPQTFDGGLEKLDTLLLADMSQLRQIKANAFTGLPNLKLLSLANSAFLASIDVDAFGQSGPELLDLSNCQLSTLDRKMLDWGRVKILKLQGNRWNCDCSLMSFLPQVVEATQKQQVPAAVVCDAPEELHAENILKAAKRNIYDFAECTSPSWHVLFEDPQFFFLALFALALLLTSIFGLLACIFLRNRCMFCFHGIFTLRERKNTKTPTGCHQQLYAPGSSFTESLIAYEKGPQQTEPAQSNRNGSKNSSNGTSTAGRHSATYSSNGEDYYSSIGPAETEGRHNAPSSPPPPPPYFRHTSSQDSFPVQFTPNMLVTMSCPVAAPPYQLRTEAKTNIQRPPSIAAPPPPPIRRIY